MKIDKLRQLWNHPAGPKTIHFWAPSFKWTLIFVSASEFSKHPSLISLNQTGALALTGLIWSRYAMVITPVNWNLFLCNLFVLLSNGYQLYRVWMWKRAGGEISEVVEQKATVVKQIDGF